jgi:hypothetical protein
MFQLWWRALQQQLSRILEFKKIKAFKKTENGVRVNGLGGLHLHIDETGYLEDFFRVYTSTKTKANVLSFADVEDLYTITYQPLKRFTVYLPDQDIVFHCRNKWYVADYELPVAVAITACTKTKTKRPEPRRHMTLHVTVATLHMHKQST